VKILLVTDWFLKLVVEGQAVALSNLGHDVRLLCRAHSEEFAGDNVERHEILQRISDAGVRVREIPGRRFGPEGVRATLAARREIRRWRPDIVSAHENDDPRLLFACYGAPLIYTVHDPEPHPGAKTPTLRERIANALWLRASDCIVVHGAALVAELSNGMRKKPVRVVPHGIDVEGEPLPKPSEETVLLFGRMESYKGVPILLDAMKQVWESRPETKLVIAGRGPAVADVPSDLRIELIARYISEFELRQLLARATVVVLPYTQASQSGVGLLSIAHGVPIVVTDVGGLPDLVPDRRYVAGRGDVDALADRLLFALDAGLAERRHFQSHAETHFAWARVAEQYAGVYREWIGNSS
jgi:glycosyltransferase involved in cell wall biosynthesis